MIIRITPALLCLVALFVSGCAKQEEAPAVSEADAADAARESKKHAAAHVHQAPHGGELIEIGDHQYNVELVLEDGTLTAYVLGGHASKSVSIAQDTLDFDIEGDDGDEVEVEMKADPQDGDEDGKSSRFVATGEAVPATLKSLEGVHGHVHITIGGDEFLGDLAHEDHDEGHDDHKGHDDDKDHKGEHKDGDNDKGEHKDEKAETKDDAVEKKADAAGTKADAAETKADAVKTKDAGETKDDAVEK